MILRKILPLLFFFAMFSCSSGEKHNDIQLETVEMMNGKGKISLPKDFSVDKYHLSQSNKDNVRFKSKSNDKTVTIQHLPKMFTDLKTGISMYEQESNSKGSKVLKREIMSINDRPFAVQESELMIDQNPTFKIDALTLLDQTILSINISCYQKDQQEWAPVARKILESIVIEN